jgi:hypothetical protein
VVEFAGVDGAVDPLQAASAATIITTIAVARAGIGSSVTAR